jgi:hypothetical protein
MSSVLRKPGTSIAKGTFWALEATFGIYVAVLIMMSSAVERDTFYRDLSVLQDVRISARQFEDQTIDCSASGFCRSDTDRPRDAGINIYQCIARSVRLFQDLAGDSQGRPDPRTGGGLALVLQHSMQTVVTNHCLAFSPRYREERRAYLCCASNMGHCSACSLRRQRQCNCQSRDHVHSAGIRYHQSRLFRSTRMSGSTQILYSFSVDNLTPV